MNSISAMEEGREFALHFEIQTCTYTQINTHWDDFHEHTDSYSRLYFIVEGSGRFQYNSVLYRLRTHHCYLVPAETPIKLLSSPGMCHFWLHFTACIFHGIDLFSLYAPPVEIMPDDPKLTAESFERLSALSKEEGFIPSAGRMQLLLELLMPFLYKSQVKKKADITRDMERFRTCLDYIDENLHRDIRVEELAGLLSLNTNYFSNIFTEKFGGGPKRFILNRRIQKAMQLLWSTEEPIKQIAASLGFSDLCYFYRSFKTVCGITPGVYRQGRNKMVSPE
jgi:AraC-like DNA-binding protein